MCYRLQRLRGRAAWAIRQFPPESQMPDMEQWDSVFFFCWIFFFFWSCFGPVISMLQSFSCRRLTFILCILKVCSLFSILYEPTVKRFILGLSWDMGLKPLNAVGTVRLGGHLKLDWIHSCPRRMFMRLGMWSEKWWFKVMEFIVKLSRHGFVMGSINCQLDRTGNYQ